jgi:hypothetical protein
VVVRARALEVIESRLELASIVQDVGKVDPAFGVLAVQLEGAP